jgi:pSer/pThr/pTyr-binding forkhead associated (FHA) protein
MEPDLVEGVSREGEPREATPKEPPGHARAFLKASYVYWLKHHGTRFPVHQGDCVLGRSPNCFIVLSSLRTSREHAVVRIGRNGLEVEDLTSTNGTRVNGCRIERRRCLEPGDVLELGDERLEVVVQKGRDIPETLDDETIAEVPEGVAQRSVLELVEVLLLKATETEQRPVVAQSIRAMVDALLRNAEQQGLLLNRAERARLMAAVQVVSRWGAGLDWEAWGTRLYQMLKTWR